MRHAFLIIAHDCIDELQYLIKALDNNYNDIFIHLDKRASFGPEELSGLVSHSTLTFLKRQKVVWGGSSQIEVELNLFEAAYAEHQYQYFHLLSGVDYPVKPMSYIHNFFENHNGENFIKIEDNPSNFDMRFDQYHLLQNVLVGKKRNLWKYADFASCYLQRLIGIRRFRNNPDRPMHKYINWVSVTEEVVALLVQHRSSILRQYRWTYCCDEVFLLAQIWNTPLRRTISPLGNLRFIEWKWFSKHDSSPRVLTIDDLDTLQEPDILFARKFQHPKSDELYAALAEVKKHECNKCS